MWADDYDLDEADGRLARIARLSVGLVLAIAVAGLVWTALKNTPPPGRHAIRYVTRVEISPPPPPPLRPPEPEKQFQSLNERQQTLVEPPSAQQRQKPPSQLSPLTAPAGSGSNPYGLQVGSGTGDIVESPERTEQVASAGFGFAAYGHVVASQVRAALQRDEKLRYGHFLVEVSLWVDASGRVTQVRMTTSSGDAATDSALTRALLGLSVGQLPPRDMPQPIRLRARGEPG